MTVRLLSHLISCLKKKWEKKKLVNALIVYFPLYVRAAVKAVQVEAFTS